MLIKMRLSNAWDAYGTMLLERLFTAVLLGRFLFPFFYNPLDRIATDMQRHFNNGINLFTPNFFNGLDPKTYQVWLYLLHLFPSGLYHFFYAFFTGLLCAGMPWFWYKALREITTRRKSLLLAIIIGTHLSLLVIYSLFMIETMMLTIVALSAWMTLRAVRKRTFAAFMAATVCWIAAAFTKQTILPMMMMGMGYALLGQPDKLKAFAAACALFLLAIIPASWQSYEALHFFAPFGFAGKETIIRKCGYLEVGFTLGNNKNGYGVYYWRGTAFDYNPLTPVASYTAKRISNQRYITGNIDLTQGRSGWEKALYVVEQKHTWMDVLHEYEENVVYLFFDHSWPDSNPGLPSLWLNLNFDLRWTWFPCFMLLLFYGPFARLAPHKMWIVMVAIAITWAFLLQDVAVVEGRYRKLIEPFMIAGVFFILESWWAPVPEKRVSLWEFITQIYVYPLLRQLLAPIFPTGEMDPLLEPLKVPAAPKASLWSRVKEIAKALE